jgi:hypothetical protein
MTTAQLRGFYAPDFVPDGRQRHPVGSWAPGVEGAPRTIEIADARALQAQSDISEAEFFARHGFVLLPHASAVRNWDHDVASLYLPEIDRLARERLLPGRRLEVQLGANLLRRGRDTPVPFYAEGVHSDGGLNLEDFVHNIDAFAKAEAAQSWRARYERDDVAGLVWIDFWRPTNMQRPLEHMPLALCDSVSLDAQDLVHTGLTGIAPEGRETNHVALRFNPEQRWFYYPQMTCEEVLAFKLAEFWKDPTPLRNCFHSAFRDAAAPADAEQRQSCELRVGVLVLKD